MFRFKKYEEWREPRKDLARLEAVERQAIMWFEKIQDPSILADWQKMLHGVATTKQKIRAYIEDNRYNV